MLDLEEVYTREFPVVYKYLLALCGDASLAEELAQETFYRAIQLEVGRGEYLRLPQMSDAEFAQAAQNAVLLWER